MDFGGRGLGDGLHRDVKECKLIQGPLALVAQSVLVLLVIGALIWKRHVERPCRPWKTWLYDVGKQGVSSFFIHLFNTAMSMGVSYNYATTSQCSWYFVVYVIDNTVGVALALLFHRLMVNYAQRRSTRRIFFGPFVRDRLLPSIDNEPGKQLPTCWDIVAACGYYGFPPSFWWWAIQLTEWLLAVVLSRIVTACIVVFCKPYGLVRTAALIDKWFTGHPGALLFTVLVFFPLVANIAQAILKDAILKSRLLSRAFSPDTRHSRLDSALLSSVDESRSEDGKSPRQRRVTHGADDA